MGADELPAIIGGENFFIIGRLPVGHVGGDGVPELDRKGNSVFHRLLFMISEKLLVGLMNRTKREQVAGPIGQGGLGHVDSASEDRHLLDRLLSDRHPVASIVEDRSLCVTCDCRGTAVLVGPLCKLSCLALGVKFDRDMARSVDVSGKGSDRFVSGDDGPIDLLGQM